MDQWTPQRRPLSTYGSAFRRRRNFHRIGVGIAGAIIAIGSALMGAAVIRLELLELLRADRVQGTDPLPLKRTGSIFAVYRAGAVSCAVGLCFC